MLTAVTIIVVSYLIGSIPTSVIVGKMARGIDIREYGSGNAGATNVYRILGLNLAVVVFVIEAGKAAATVLFVTRLRLDPLPLGLPLFQVMAGLAVIAGNVWPVFAGFSGGKGVTTSAGVLLALAPVATGCAAAVWIVITLLTRYVSLGSMSASLTLPAIVAVQRFFFHHRVPSEVVLFTALLPIAIIATHRSNIKRLLSGTESRIGTKKRKFDAHHP